MRADQPLVVISKSGSAADTAARRLGLKVGVPASKAQAIVANLTMIDADPAADAAALERLTLWALRQYSPVVAVDGTDGIVMDTEGADHLQGGEDLLISGLVNASDLDVRDIEVDGRAGDRAGRGRSETV